MNTQYRKNLKAVLEASKNYTDKKIEDLRWELGTYDLDIESDNTIAYQKIVPSGTIKAKIDKIGGMSYKSENLIGLEDKEETTTATGLTYKVENDIVYLNATSLSDTTAIYLNLKAPITANENEVFSSYTGLTTGNKSQWYLTSNNSTSSSGGYRSLNKIVNNGREVENTTLTNVDNHNTYSQIYIYIPSDAVFDNISYTFMLAKGSTSPTEYKQYFSGIRDSAITSVVSKDSNNTTLETKTIDSHITALTGYGWGINDTCYNYIDYENKKFIQKVGRVDLGSNDISYTYNSQYNYFKLNTNIGIKLVGFNTTTNSLCALYDAVSQSAFASLDKVMFIVNTQNLAIKDTTYTDATTFKTAMSGVYLYYELATPIETDISQYLDDNFIEVEAGGTNTFNNTYNQAVPSEIDYLVEEVKA